MGKSKGRRVSVDDLAAMTARGFDDVYERIGELATKGELADVRAEILESIGKEGEEDNRLNP